MKLLRLANLFLTAILLNSCAGFPKISPHVLSVKNGKCGEYEIEKKSNQCNVRFKFKQWHPIEHCDGYFAISADDVAKIKEYQAKQCSEKN